MSALCRKEKCVGCTSCVEKCPKGAISIKTNNLGERYVSVDEAKCINCGICSNVCPSQNNDMKSNTTKDVYCISFNDEIVKESSSGGVFFMLAEKACRLGWFVCGAVYSDDYLTVQHIISQDIEDIKKMRGSKYVESNLNGVLNTLDEIIIDKNQCVLFSGTPCQCAAIKKRYQKNLDNVFLVEIICNGVMAPLILSKQILKYGQAENSDIVSYSMRYKKEEYFPIFARIVFKNKKEIIEPLYSSDLGAIYGSRVLLRESCYHCLYKGNQRVADLSLGDYRGFRVEEEKKHSIFGASMVLVNSDKGHRLVQMIETNAVMSKALSITEAFASNNRLIINGFAPSKKTRNKFRNKLLVSDITFLRKDINKYYQKKYVIIRKLVELVELRRALRRYEF